MDTSLQTQKRTARPGDICVLLEPAEDRVAELRQLQKSLQYTFGGRPHQRVHMTCQRFELWEGRLLSDTVQHLRTSLVATRPFRITAMSLVQVEHRFWQSRLLRWRVEITPEVRGFVRLVEDGLVAARIVPHFSHTAGWMPTLVTALEAIPETDLDLHLGNMAYPQYLFTGRQVVLSKILGQGEFDILETIQLVDDH